MTLPSIRSCVEIDKMAKISFVSSAMGQSIWDLKVGDRISLDSGAVAEVITPTEDGEWVLVKYVEAPESPKLSGRRTCAAPMRFY